LYCACTPLTVIVKFFSSIGKFSISTITYHPEFILYLQEKAKEFRKNKAQENVRAESYLASNEEPHPKKKKSTKSK
jgi:hypothetical protein